MISANCCSNHVSVTLCCPHSESSFYYDANGHIIIPITIKDTIEANLLFDTGNGSGLLLKRSFALNNGINCIGAAHKDLLSGFEIKDTYGVTEVEDSLRISYGGATITFYPYSIIDDNSALSKIIGEADGILPVGNISSIQIDYSDCTIALNQPKNINYTDSMAIVRDSAGLITILQVPVILGPIPNNSNSTKQDFIVDTGYRGELYLNSLFKDDTFYSLIKDNSSMSFIRESRDPNISKELYRVNVYGLINRDVWAECDILNNTWEPPTRKQYCLIGLEYQKSFNFYYDFEKGMAYIVPIEYRSIVDEDSYLSENNALRLAGRFKNGSLIAMYIARTSIYSKLGVKPGDMLIAINNRPYLEMRDSVNDRLDPRNIVLSVIRDGTPITLSDTLHF